jgi:hypothetical protein
MQDLRAIIERVRDLLRVPQRLTEMQSSIQQQTEAIRAGDERQKKDRESQPVWLKPILDKYDEAETRRQTESDKQHSVQKWMCRGTWAAVVAASIYAGITFFLWKDANKNFVASQRAWVGISRPISVSTIDFISANPKATWVVSLKNYGPSVARHVSLSAVAVSTPVWAIQTQELMCRYAIGSGPKGRFVDTHHSIPQGLGDTLFPSEEEGKWFENAVFPQLSPIGEGTFFIVGCVAYVDQFDKQRTTRFCYWYYTDARKAKMPILLYQFWGLNEAN